MAIIGTVILFAYGAYSWFKPPTIYTEDVEVKQEFSFFKYLAKGFLLNGLNPFIIVFWMSIIGFVAVNHEYNTWQQAYYFMGVLTTILTTDMAKAFIAHRLRKLVTPKRIKVLNRSVGIILVLFGFRMIYYLFENFILK